MSPWYLVKHEGRTLLVRHPRKNGHCAWEQVEAVAQLLMVRLAVPEGHSLKELLREGQGNL